MRNFYLTSWSEEVLQDGDADSGGAPVIQITASWTSKIQQAPESIDEPLRIGGKIQWTADNAPNIRVDERADWIRKILKSAL